MKLKHTLILLTLLVLLTACEEQKESRNVVATGEKQTYTVTSGSQAQEGGQGDAQQSATTDNSEEQSAKTVTSSQIDPIARDNTENESVETTVEVKSVEEVDVSQTTQLTTEEGKAIGSMNISIKADITETVDCGEKNCFDERFRLCEPAKMNLKLMDGLSYTYEIIGPKDGRCEMKTYYPENLNPEWVSKEMFCNYNHILGFDGAIKELADSFNAGTNVLGCTGELYVLMKG